MDRLVERRVIIALSEEDALLHSTRRKEGLRLMQLSDSTVNHRGGDLYVRRSSSRLGVKHSGRGGNAYFSHCEIPNLIIAISVISFEKPYTCLNHNLAQISMLLNETVDTGIVYSANSNNALTDHNPFLLQVGTLCQLSFIFHLHQQWMHQSSPKDCSSTHLQRTSTVWLKVDYDADQCSWGTDKQTVSQSGRPTNRPTARADGEQVHQIRPATIGDK